jgi:CRP-like cAMP-binding protein
VNDSQIFLNIQRHIVLTAEERDWISAVFEVKDVPKKERVLEQGQICRKLYFVESGSLRAYNSNKQGKESTIMFAVQDWWITDMYSFVNQKPALLSLETLEDSRLYSLDFLALEQLFTKIPKLERFFRILFQKAYVREQLRVLDAISRTTEDRYARFVAKYPQITSKVTQKQIASYLGVTPEFLSSVKK